MVGNIIYLEIEKDDYFENDLWHRVVRIEVEEQNGDGIRNIGGYYRLSGKRKGFDGDYECVSFQHCDRYGRENLEEKNND